MIFLWRLFWLPYGLMFKHRNMLSLFPVIGTFTRLAYVGVPVFFVSQAFDIGAVPRPAVIVLGGMILGLAVSDTMHALADTASAIVKGQVRTLKR